jgi:hypothetical protein
MSPVTLLCRLFSDAELCADHRPGLSAGPPVFHRLNYRRV